MANNFSIELTGRLNQKETIKNINSSLSEIAKDSKLNSLNLTIKEVKLSKEALSKLNNLKITPTITGFNIDAQAVQANINKIGQSVGKNLSSAIVGSTSSKELKDKLKAELESIAREMRSNKLAGISKQFNINEKDTGDIAVQLKKLVKIYNDSISEMSKTITPMNMFDKSSQEFQDASNRFEQAFSTMSRAGGQIDRIVQEYGKLKDYFGTNSFFANFIDEYKGRTFYIPNAEDLSPEFGGLKGLNQAFIGHDIHFTKDETKGSYDFNELADELTRIAGIDTSSITNDMDLLNKLIEHLMVSSEKIKELTPISDIYGGDISAFSATSSNFSEIIDLIDKAGLVSKNFATQIQEVTQTEIQGTATFVLEENKKQDAIEQTNQAIQANENVGTHLFDSFSGFIGTLDQADRRLRMLADTQKEVVTISKSLDEQGKLTGFTASVKKATGEVEKLRFGLDETGEQFQFLGGTSNDSVAQNIKHYQTELDKLQKKYAQTDFDFAPLEKAIEQYRQTGTELNKLQAVYDETTRSVNEYYTALKSKDVSLDPIQQALNEMRTMDTVLNSLQDKIRGLKDNTGLLTQLNTLRQEHERLNKVIQANNGKIPFNKEWTKSYAQLSAQVKDLEKNVKNSKNKIDEFANVRLSNRIDDWLRKNTKAAKDYGAQLEEIKKQTEGADAITLKRLRAEFDAVKKAAADAGKLGKNFFETLKEGATKFTEWVMASGMIMQTVYAFKQMLVEVKNIDTAMTELAKVSDATNKQLQASLRVSIQTAKSYGATVDGIINATADWSRLGYNLPDAQKLAEIATLYKNVGDGIDIDAANTSLISTLKGYQLQTEDALSVIDAFNEVA
jgi:hypothetical protein